MIYMNSWSLLCTQSHLEAFFTPDIVICICDTFDNDFEIKNKFAKYLKKSYW